MYRVVVVEDDPDINASLQGGLRLAGFDVVGALSGFAALAEVERRCPDLVLLDQVLPDVDGLEICRRLRAAPESARVPIVFLTALAGEESRIKALAAGADDSVSKPFSMRELVLRVQAVLRRTSSPAQAPLTARLLH